MSHTINQMIDVSRRISVRPQQTVLWDASMCGLTLPSADTDRNVFPECSEKGNQESLETYFYFWLYKWSRHLKKKNQLFNQQMAKQIRHYAVFHAQLLLIEIVLWTTEMYLSHCATLNVSHSYFNILELKHYMCIVCERACARKSERAPFKSAQCGDQSSEVTDVGHCVGQCGPKWDTSVTLPMHR